MRAADVSAALCFFYHLVPNWSRALNSTWSSSSQSNVASALTGSAIAPSTTCCPLAEIATDRIYWGELQWPSVTKSRTSTCGLESTK